MARASKIYDYATPGPVDWNWPDGETEALVQVWGGGGGGAKANAITGKGGVGGGGGGVNHGILRRSATKLVLSIGRGGVPGSGGDGSEVRQGGQLCVRATGGSAGVQGAVTGGQPGDGTESGFGIAGAREFFTSKGGRGGDVSQGMFDPGTGHGAGGGSSAGLNVGGNPGQSTSLNGAGGNAPPSGYRGGNGGQTNEDPSLATVGEDAPGIGGGGGGGGVGGTAGSYVAKNGGKGGRGHIRIICPPPKPGGRCCCSCRVGDLNFPPTLQMQVTAPVQDLDFVYQAALCCRDEEGNMYPYTGETPDCTCYEGDMYGEYPGRFCIAKETTYFDIGDCGEGGTVGLNNCYQMIRDDLPYPLISFGAKQRYVYHAAGAADIQSMSPMTLVLIEDPVDELAKMQEAMSPIGHYYMADSLTPLDPIPGQQGCCNLIFTLNDTSSVMLGTQSKIVRSGQTESEHDTVKTYNIPHLKTLAGIGLPNFSHTQPQLLQTTVPNNNGYAGGYCWCLHEGYTYNGNYLGSYGNAVLKVLVCPDGSFVLRLILRTFAHLDLLWTRDSWDGYGPYSTLVDITKPVYSENRNWSLYEINRLIFSNSGKIDPPWTFEKFKALKLRMETLSTALLGESRYSIIGPDIQFACAAQVLNSFFSESLIVRTCKECGPSYFCHGENTLEQIVDSAQDIERRYWAFGPNGEAVFQ